MIFGKDKEKMSKLEKELAEAKEEINQLKNTEPLKSLEFAQNAISKIRELDLLSKSYFCEKDWEDKYVNNNLIEYSLLLRAELNALYCLFSQNKLENQIDNIHKIFRFKSDKGIKLEEILNQIKELNKKKNFSLNNIIKKDERNAEYNIIHKARNSYNRNLNAFPNNFFYGIEEDKKF